MVFEIIVEGVDVALHMFAFVFRHVVEGIGHILELSPLEVDHGDLVSDDPVFLFCLLAVGRSRLSELL